VVQTTVMSVLQKHQANSKAGPRAGSFRLVAQ